MAKKKKKKNKSHTDREEYGAGYDLSPDDLEVIGQNNAAKANNNHENKGKPANKENPSKLNQ